MYLVWLFCLAVWLAYFRPSCCVWSRCVLLSRASWRVRVYRRIVVSLVRPLAKNLSTLLSPPFIYSLKYVLVGYLRGNQNTKTRHRYPHRPTPTFMNAGPLCCLFVLYVHHEREPRPTSQSSRCVSSYRRPSTLDRRIVAESNRIESILSGATAVKHVRQQSGFYVRWFGSEVTMPILDFRR